MFKKPLLITALFAITSGIAVANTAPYLGASLGIVNNTTSGFPYFNNENRYPNYFRGVPFNVMVGYGGSVNPNFYAAAELIGTLGTASISDHSGLKTSYGYGVSLLPGLVLSDYTYAFLRLGVVRTRFSDAGETETGGQVGLGLQTTVAQNIDVRGEYDFTGYSDFNNNKNKISAPRSDAFILAILYKFD